MGHAQAVIRKIYAVDVWEPLFPSWKTQGMEKKNRRQDQMTENEAIEELKSNCNELGKAIPCDTGLGMAVNEAYGMAIKSLECRSSPADCQHTVYR